MKENLKNLDVLNKEEYDAIRNLCYEFRNIIYCGKLPLSFTNQINMKLN